MGDTPREPADRTAPEFRLLAITPPDAVPSPRHLRTWLDVGVSPRDIAVLVRRPASRARELVEMLARDRDWRAMLGACREANVDVLVGIAAAEVMSLTTSWPREGLAGVQLRGDPNADTVRTVRHALAAAAGNDVIVGRSIHGSLPSEQSDADYSCLAPIFAPRTPKPNQDSQPLGLATLAAWAEPGTETVFALGGVAADTARACLDHGAHGLAGIRAFFGEFERVREDVTALHEAIVAASPRR